MTTREPDDAPADSSTCRPRPARWPVPVLAGAGLLALYILRPGVVENGVRSVRVWLVVIAAVAAARLAGVAAGRVSRRPAVASAASGVVVAVVAAALLLPSFRQRSLDEPFPTGAAAALPSAQLSPPSENRPPPPASPATPATPQASAPAQPEPASAANPAAPPGQPRRLSAGPLDGLGHSASGRTALYDIDGATVLRFEDVDIEGTPDPYVYLVPRGARSPEGGVLLGRLKAERGTFSYTVPSGADPAATWSVLVWCRPYDTPVAVADHT